MVRCDQRVVGDVRKGGRRADDDGAVRLPSRYPPAPVMPWMLTSEQPASLPSRILMSTSLPPADDDGRRGSFTGAAIASATLFGLVDFLDIVHRAIVLPSIDESSCGELLHQLLRVHAAGGRPPRRSRRAPRSGWRGPRGMAGGSPSALFPNGPLGSSVSTKRDVELRGVHGGGQLVVQQVAVERAGRCRRSGAPRSARSRAPCSCRRGPAPRPACGLMSLPLSWTLTMSSTFTLPSGMSTSTSAKQAAEGEGVVLAVVWSPPR